MERNTRGFRGTSSSPFESHRADRLNPASRRVNRSLRAAEFAQFALDIQRDLNPRGPLEALVARQAVRSAWRLKENIEAEVTDPLSDIATNQADRAARSLEVAITTLDLLQGRRDESVLPLVTDDAIDPAIAPNEWPIVPANNDEADSGDDFRALDVPEEDDESPIWHGRLVYDFDVSDHSPVVKGTWITVSHIVSLIVDGATWAEILRTHPELAEADIRMCVAYAVAEDNSDL